MTVALVAHLGFQAGQNGGTSSAINTTGANLIVVGVNWYLSTPAGGTLTDSKGNTWTPLTAQTAVNPNSQLYYCVAPTVGSGHTFSYVGTSIYSVVFVQAFSGVAASPFDGQNGATGSSSTLQTGSVTPSANNGLIVALGSGTNGVASATIDSGFTISDQVAGGGANWFGAMAYLIQTTAAAVNPTFTFNAATTNSAEIAAFKGTSGGGGGGKVNNKWFSLGGL